jgi:hypothetical protein
MQRKFFDYAGVIASVLLIAVGIGTIAVATAGHSEVGTQLKREQIKGTPDMTPALIKKAISESGLENVQGVPTCTVADKKIESGEDAKCFAQYMRIHALESTGGRTYSQMGQFLTADGKETSDKTEAAKDPKTGAPVSNGARNVWVTETALSTALNTSFFAQQVARFSIAMGIALLLIGVGFLVLTMRWLRGPETAPRS